MAEEIAKIISPYTETRNLDFFSGETCGLDLANRALAAGNHDYALEVSTTNAESCSPDAPAGITNADMAAAHYNVAVLYWVGGDPDASIAALAQARRANPGDEAVKAAIEELRSVQQAADDVRKAEERTRARRRSPSS